MNSTVKLIAKCTGYLLSNKLPIRRNRLTNYISDIRAYNAFHQMNFPPPFFTDLLPTMHTDVNIIATDATRRGTSINKGTLCDSENGGLSQV